MKGIVVAGALALVVAFGVSTASAQESCGSFQAMCAQRCKQRVPDDKQCVPDHCLPKYQECKTTGCWQEGKAYGGKLTCNLKKS